MPVFEPNEIAAMTVQGRGQAARTGEIGLVLNPGRSVEEADYDNNNFTFEVSIQWRVPGGLW